MGVLLPKEEFCFRLVNDIKKHFLSVQIEKDYLYIESGPANVSIPVQTIYHEYCQIRDYAAVLNYYTDLARKILNQHRFQLNYNNVYPMLKHEDFGTDQQHLSFFRQPLFEDIHLLFVSDEGELFRFVLDTDVSDEKRFMESAFANLNKLTNILQPVHESLDVYALRYNSDYAATMLLNKHIRQQINKKVGSDFLFCLPSATSLLVAKDHPDNIQVLRFLMEADHDPNKISDAIYRFKDGQYSAAVKNSACKPSALKRIK